MTLKITKIEVADSNSPHCFEMKLFNLEMLQAKLDICREAYPWMKIGVFLAQPGSIGWQGIPSSDH